MFLPGWFLERSSWGWAGTRVDDSARSSSPAAAPASRRGSMLTHGNIAANVESMVAGHRPRPARPRPRRAAVLPQLRLHGDAVGAAAGRARRPSTTPTRGRPRRSANCAASTAARSASRRATFLRFYLRQCEPDDFRTHAHARLRRGEAAAGAGAGVRGEVRRAAAGGLRLHGAVAGRRARTCPTWRSAG